MHILGAILIGFLAGLVAKFVTPGKDPGGCFITTILGIAGALVAKYVGQAVGFYGPNDPVGFIAAVGGAVLLLVLFRLVRGKSKKA